MFWDLIILAITITFTSVGWAKGLSRTWYSVPIAVVIATVVSQRIYIDLATVFAAFLHMQPIISVFIAYLTVWIIIEQIFESILTRTGPAPEDKSAKFLKIAGATMGGCKSLLAFVLAAMVTYSHSSVPSPPEKAWQATWLAESLSHSQSLLVLHNWAAALNPHLGKFVISEADPDFVPDFSIGDDPFEKVRKRRERWGFNYIKKYKQAESELNKSLSR